jgi:hypothetical protein
MAGYGETFIGYVRYCTRPREQHAQAAAARHVRIVGRLGWRGFAAWGREDGL